MVATGKGAPDTFSNSLRRTIESRTVANIADILDDIEAGSQSR